MSSHGAVRFGALIVALVLTSFSFAQNTPAGTENAAAGPSTGSYSAAADDLVEVRHSEIEIENPKHLKLPVALIQRIFRETVREVAQRLNPNRPPLVLAKVTLRIGEPGFNVETTVDKERKTIIRMEAWSETGFARMVARAARHGLFSDDELDLSAAKALAKVHATTSVTELKQAQ